MNVDSWNLPARKSNCHSNELKLQLAIVLNVFILQTKDSFQMSTFYNQVVFIAQKNY